MKEKEIEDALYRNYKIIEGTLHGTITKKNDAYFQRVGWGIEAYLKPEALKKEEAIRIMEKELSDYYEYCEYLLEISIKMAKEKERKDKGQRYMLS